MSTFTNLFKMIRETQRLEGERRIPPSPNNYQTLCHENVGTKPAAGAFREWQLSALASTLPKSSPDQLRLTRKLDEAVKATNWDNYKKHLGDFVAGLAESQKPGCSELIADLLCLWDVKHPGLTAARKRESLEHILTSCSANPDTLFTRLRSVYRSWEQDKDAEPVNAIETGNSEIAPISGLTAATTDLLHELRELFAFTLESATATQLNESPQLSTDAKALAKTSRHQAGDESTYKAKQTGKNRVVIAD